MSIQHFFDKAVRVQRIKTLNGYKTYYVGTGTFDMHIQRLTDQSSFAIYGVQGATHKAWCDISNDIKGGDRAIDSNGNQFEIVDVTKRDFGGNQHLEIIMKKFDT